MKQLGDILFDTLQDLGMAKRYRAESAILHWPKIVGQDIAAHAVPIAVQRDIMVISVDNSVWCHHLSMMKEDVINKVNDFIGEKLIVDIRFKAGYLEKNQNYNQDKENFKTINQKLKLIRLDQEELQEAEALVRNVSEAGLQQKVLNIIKKQMAFTKLKKLNSWHKCSGCESLCPPELTYCTVCSLEDKEKKMGNIRKLLIEAPWLTYAELSKYIECLPEEFINAKTTLIIFFANSVKHSQHDNLEVMTLVMLVTGAKPEDVTEKLVQKTLAKFGRKNYVFTSGL